MTKFWLQTILYWVTVIFLTGYYVWQTGEVFWVYIIIPVAFIVTLIDYAIEKQRVEPPIRGIIRVDGYNKCRHQGVT